MAPARNAKLNSTPAVVEAIIFFSSFLKRLFVARVKVAGLRTSIELIIPCHLLGLNCISSFSLIVEDVQFS